MEEIKTRIYIADVSPLYQLDQLKKYLRSLSPERQEKADRLKSINSKALSIGAEVILQKAVLKSFGIKEQLKLIKGEGVKPRCSDHPNIHFNLSHSGRFVVCAISNEPVGVDIEQRDRVNFQLAKRFFHAVEVAWILSLPVEDQQQGLCDLWSIKESYMKYTGKGFGLPMNAFAVNINGQFPEKIEVSIFEQAQKKNVSLKKYRCPENYVLWCSNGSNRFDNEIEWVKL
ncbi:4'-phosphopantetheinyl transferase superfamily protein [Acetobacterium paludosum]|uniref:4'-phosphopantetheinyl transferase superfamily protein n=1 Tax=Acetobacterium paludosum TaxID=52693 RepID=A0A923HVI2_9FIRM|nr:4'-phosphopantetheinyl transferase superfamily protein [Acetobacterium paludosum]MBC3888010.1 4'-phosphopantetheinyl transferase superfamily protein [Acetobacterium paludosum]